MQFDGNTYDKERDHDRLQGQSKRIFDLMKDGVWRTLRMIAEQTGDPESSVSARLRDLRKTRFGGHTVLRATLTAGVFKYRVILAGMEFAKQ
jgi:hypothetical protein